MARRVRQLDLDLPETRVWGGRRAGAGRKCGPSPRHSHRARGALAARFPCHVTLKVKNNLPSLRSVRLVRELERSFAAACDRGRFRLVHYSVQNDHVHLIAEAVSQRDLACGMKSVAARLARAVNRVFHRRGRVLADRYHVHILRTPREVRNALAYVLLNARRHLAKLGRRLTAPKLDPASSARWFDGWRAGFSAGARGGPCPVAPPHTWLLRVGWRRHGAIDPGE